MSVPFKRAARLNPDWFRGLAEPSKAVRSSKIGMEKDMSIL